jgi:protocatechuate 3,4-dioxygenase beta subunit
MKKKFALYAALLALGLGLLTGARAQTSTVGSISGTVRDAQGAAVPKAEVTIQEETTGQTRTVRTDDDGSYSAQSLPVGRYSVSAAPQGFKRRSPPESRCTSPTGWSSTSTSRSARSARR